MGFYSTAMTEPGSYMSWSDVQRMIGGAPGLRNRTILFTLAHTGRRVSEVVGPQGIRMRDIVWEDYLINFTILKKKSAGRRPMEVPYVLMDVLREYVLKEPPLTDDEPLFGITPRRVNQIIKKIAKREGIRCVNGSVPSAHTFRHSYAIRLAKTGKDSAATLYKIQDALQHSDIRMTQTYLRFAGSEKRDLINEAAEAE